MAEAFPQLYCFAETQVGAAERDASSLFKTVTIEILALYIFENIQCSLDVEEPALPFTELGVYIGVTSSETPLAVSVEIEKFVAAHF